MKNEVIIPDFTRDIRESDIPREVLRVLLADRTTGKNILWMTDGYAHLESVSGAMTRESSKNLVKNLKTRFARFLVSLAKSRKHGTSKTFRYVLLQDFTSYSDIDWTRPLPKIARQLYDKYALTAPARGFIKSMIKPMG